MKDTTKLLKELGQYCFGIKGKTKKKIITERHEYLLFETKNKQRFALEYDKCYRRLKIFREFDHFDAPTYEIPDSFLHGSYKFGKCPTCGNLAIIGTQGTASFIACIQPPNFHHIVIDTNEGKARE